MIVLGIETSCDETAAAISSDGTILSSCVASQTIHESYGGVVPELASREHEQRLNTLVDTALHKAGLTLNHLEGIAVTQGPGLAGTLLTGVSFAKGLALGMDIPLIGINHLEAHIFANFLADPELKYPFVCLLVSGGHSQLWLVRDLDDYELLGETRDDAAGEAFDKGARILGLGYPGGPAIEILAKGGKPSAVHFPRAFLHQETLEFSFSGLKTALLYYMDSFRDGSSDLSLADVAASYQEAIIEILTAKLSLAIRKTDVTTGVVAGGVAANHRLRDRLQSQLPGVRILFPDLQFCTDNAGMIAFLGELKLRKGISSVMDFRVEPNLRLGR